jgi:dihydroflavonol-4-reductase
VIALTSRPDAIAALGSEGLRIEGRGFSEETAVDLLGEGMTVVHLAAIRNRPGTRPSEFERINVRAAEQLALACRAAGVKRFINVSTAFIYGPSWFIQSDAYLSSKVAALDRMESVEGLPLVTLMLPIVFGTDFPTARNRIANHIRFVLRAPFVPLIGPGDARRPLVYVADVVRAILDLDASDDAGRFTLPAEAISQAEFDRRVAALAGKKLNFIHFPERLVLYTARIADILRRLEPATGYVRRIEALALEWQVPTERPGFQIARQQTPFDEALAITVRSLIEG